jgi:glycerol-3-phosphate acyltransferase PlsY
VVGHCYPLWYGFRGGKGAATAVGALAVIQPLVLLPMFLVWVVTLVLTGWVGLATILSGLSLVPAFAVFDPARGHLVFAALLALFLVFTHRENIARLRAGTENRFERIRIVNWFRRD